jgi:hypothetical protein
VRVFGSIWMPYPGAIWLRPRIFAASARAKVRLFGGLSRKCEPMVALHLPMRGEADERRRSAWGCCGAAKTPPRSGMAAVNGPCDIGLRALFIGNGCGRGVAIRVWSSRRDGVAAMLSTGAEGARLSVFPRDPDGDAVAPISDDVRTVR